MGMSLELHCKYEEFGCPEIIPYYTKCIHEDCVTSGHTAVHDLDGSALLLGYSIPCFSPDRLSQGRHDLWVQMSIFNCWCQWRRNLHMDGKSKYFFLHCHNFRFRKHNIKMNTLAPYIKRVMPKTLHTRFTGLLKNSPNMITWLVVGLWQITEFFLLSFSDHQLLWQILLCSCWSLLSSVDSHLRGIPQPDRQPCRGLQLQLQPGDRGKWAEAYFWGHPTKH